MTRETVFITGGSGLIGRNVVRALLADPGVERVYALARRPAPAAERLVHIAGDLERAALGLSPEAFRVLSAEATMVIHLAATTSFSQTADEARAVNVYGTRHLLETSARWSSVRRWVHVSTAFVAGTRTGRILETDVPPENGWVNEYEASKAEAERVVRVARPDAVIVRPSTIACDDVEGAVTQVNAIHRALRIYFRGLAAMIPGTDQTRLDAVTAEYVTRGVVAIARAPGVDGRTFHLCAGEGAMPLDALLDTTHTVFARSADWKRRGIARPLRADLATYRMFERAVEAAGSQRVIQAVRSLGHFAPQLAFPKVFDTREADAIVGAPAPSVASFWSAMVGTLAGETPREEAA